MKFALQRRILENYKHLLIDCHCAPPNPLVHIVYFPVIAFEMAFIRHMQAIAYTMNVLHQHFQEEKQATKD